MSTNTGPVTVAGMVLDGITDVTDTGGVNAPEKKTEQGFSWDSYVDSKPLQVEITAWVPPEQYSALAGLRDQSTPIAASVGQVVLDNAVVEELEVTNDAETVSHYEVSFQLREVKIASTETTNLTIATGNGAASGSATDQRPSFTGSQPDNTGQGQKVQDKSSDDGNFVRDIVGGAADAIQDVFGP